MVWIGADAREQIAVDAPQGQSLIPDSPERLELGSKESNSASLVRRPTSARAENKNARCGTLNAIAEALQKVSKVVAVLLLRHQPRSPAYRALQRRLVVVQQLREAFPPHLWLLTSYPTLWYILHCGIHRIPRIYATAHRSRRTFGRRCASADAR